MAEKKRLHPDVFIGIGMLLIGVYIFLRSRQFPETAARFPGVFSLVLAVLSLIIIIQGLTKRIDEAERQKWLNSKYSFIVIGIIALYAIGIDVIGFYISTVLFMVGCMYFMRVKSWKTIIMVTVFTNAAIWAIFEKLLMVKMP